MKTIPPKPEMERAVRDRDASYDGIFFTGVRTTGIFCRPSCVARKPLPKNVEYFATIRDALLAGFRACKRCRPMDSNGKPPEWVELLLSRMEELPHERLRDADLRAMDIDSSRARRYFNKHYGMTFQGYQRARRMGSALGRLRAGGDLLEVGLKSGYESSSGFRDAFGRVFGDPPGRGRRSGCILTALVASPLGPLITGATEDGVCLLEFADRPALERQTAILRKRLRTAVVPGTNEHLECLMDELARYFAGELTRFTFPLVVPGTPFQQAVWKGLQQIPYGSRISYERLAANIGRPGACRAVGRANGDNRLAIIIPCHRVVQKNGALRGYGGGLWRKQFLLNLEHETFARSKKNPRDDQPTG